MIKTPHEALIYDIVKIYLEGISKTSHQYNKITKKYWNGREDLQTLLAEWYKQIAGYVLNTDHNTIKQM